jgi:hypothetical protein
MSILKVKKRTKFTSHKNFSNFYLWNANSIKNKFAFVLNGSFKDTDTHRFDKKFQSEVNNNIYDFI